MAAKDATDLPRVAYDSEKATSQREKPAVARSRTALVPATTVTIAGRCLSRVSVALKFETGLSLFQNKERDVELEFSIHKATLWRWFAGVSLQIWFLWCTGSAFDATGVCYGVSNAEFESGIL